MKACSNKTAAKAERGSTSTDGGEGEERGVGHGPRSENTDMRTEEAPATELKNAKRKIVELEQISPIARSDTLRGDLDP